jgi:hypothetical protein
MRALLLKLHSWTPTARRAAAIALAFVLGLAHPGFAHDPTRQLSEIRRARAQAQERDRSEPAPSLAEGATSCRATVELRLDGSPAPIDGLVRVTNLATGKALTFPDQIQRPGNWYAISGRTILPVPRAKIRFEAMHGLETELQIREVDLTGTAKSTVTIPLKRFYDAGARGLRSGNTHLHLQKLTYDEAMRYLRVVSAADDLDLVFLSHLRRTPDDSKYISNALTSADLARLSRAGALFGNGQEHRHNFGRSGEGYGHVLFLDILKLIEPVSVGPGLMQEGTDGIPLQRGIRAARKDGATVIWCHNTRGFEDVPNWVAGLVDAQNIFDDGSPSNYEDTFYRYLDIGMRVPFSTGTDWFIYDFSRVYVPVSGGLTSKKWLAALARGQSYITNGVFLELEADGKGLGDTIAVRAGQELRIAGRALGRADFGRLELVYNGKVIHTVAAGAVGGHHEAVLDWKLIPAEPGWIALRIPTGAGQNELGHPLFGHTGPIYLESGGQRLFRPEVARGLVEEMRRGMEEVGAKGVFANDQERETVLSVYRRSIAALEKRIAESR